MSHPLPILLLHGDAEALLLADAASALQAALPHREVQLRAAWVTRPDLLSPGAPAPPKCLRERGLIPDVDVRDLLEDQYRLVLISLFPAVALPGLRHESGGVFLAHRAFRARWSREEAAVVAAECVEEAPPTPEDAASALEPIIARMQGRGVAVAICTTFRHVGEPLQHRQREGPPSLRELTRRTNLQVARLSQRTGCFVFDVDRPLAQEGAASLGADCFGGAGRAAELALDELITLLFDALPDDAMPTGAA